MSLKKRILSGPLALLVGLSAVCLLLFADASSAAVPPVGVNCVATDGKINGRGATYQTKMQEAFANGFRDSVCGPTEDTERSGSEKEPAGNTMVAYNYPKAAAASATGSGNGLKAATCRTDAYAGSDIPYLNQQLVGLEGFNLWGPPGELEHDKANGVCNIAFTPPYPPNESAWPNEHDQEAEMMSFPVTGSSVALVADLPTEKCNGTKVNKLEFTPKEVTRIFGGDAHTWNDTELRENNTELAECHDEITRVVRQDTSGTTNIFKSYLVRAANERAAAGATCGTNSSVAPNIARSSKPQRRAVARN
jgi:ABC-type phosphate transport system substrate-binding protein